MSAKEKSMYSFFYKKNHMLRKCSDVEIKCLMKEKNDLCLYTKNHSAPYIYLLTYPYISFAIYIYMYSKTTRIHNRKQQLNNVLWFTSQVWRIYKSLIYAFSKMNFTRHQLEMLYIVWNDFYIIIMEWRCPSHWNQHHYFSKCVSWGHPWEGNVFWAFYAHKISWRLKYLHTI